MMTVSQLFIYPVKSLGGIEVTSAVVQERGFKYDRRWMLVDANNQFLTQREWPVMAFIKTAIENDQLVLSNKKVPGQRISFPPTLDKGESVRVRVWEDECDALLASDEINKWCSLQVDMPCKLVYMPDDSVRPVEQKYAHHEEITSFSDAYPFLIIGQSSLDELNSRLEESLPINRFRPNIVFTGGLPFEEDVMEHFTINGVNFFGVKLCSRCVMTTINQENGIKNKEPLKTLATYRKKGNNIYFGQNLLHQGHGSINVNDQIKFIKRKEPIFPLAD